MGFFTGIVVFYSMVRVYGHFFFDFGCGQSSVDCSGLGTVEDLFQKAKERTVKWEIPIEKNILEVRRY